MSESLEELVLGDVSFHFAKLSNAICQIPLLRSLSITIPKDYSGIVITQFIDALLSLKCFTCLDLGISGESDETLDAIANASLPLRRLFVNSFCSKFSNVGILNLLTKSNLLQHLDLQLVLLLFEPLVNLISINLSRNFLVSELSFLAIVRHCPLITVIKMVSTSLGSKNIEEESLVDMPVNFHVKVLCLACNQDLKDETVKMIVSVCPSLENLDLSNCDKISEGAVVEVFKRCYRISDLSLVNYRLSQFQFEFEVPTLFVLNLSRLMISDEAPYAITKSACKVKHLNLDFCNEITEKGVRQAVINCKQLKVISLKSCEKVTADVVDWMVHERPVFRKIVVSS
ncbi:hypothetical protein PIB30_012090 [Stylosanthes scabra]|uniref:Uncharacterized protein n=1 Tax=Stylosanthes scabra TaxID=79078 RepID=A0ABU6R5W3_9FABA|nr:hypothetical protein [Stylosanthes scabra]